MCYMVINSGWVNGYWFDRNGGTTSGWNPYLLISIIVDEWSLMEKPRHNNAFLRPDIYKWCVISFPWWQDFLLLQGCDFLLLNQFEAWALQTISNQIDRIEHLLNNNETRNKREDLITPTLIRTDKGIVIIPQYLGSDVWLGKEDITCSFNANYSSATLLTFNL